MLHVIAMTMYMTRTALSMHARLAAPCQHRLSLARPFSSCATVLHAGRVRASVVFSQIFSVITQNLTSGIPAGIPQFRILQEAR